MSVSLTLNHNLKKIIEFSSFKGLMGIFSFHFNYGRNNFYVNYGNEQTGILYGEIWLGSEAFILQSCGENCAMWCEVNEEKMLAFL